MKLPPSLVTSVNEGKVILFLGAGAAIGATSSSGETPPSGEKLAKILSDKFLGGEESNKSLASVSEFAESQHDLLAVQDFLREYFIQFEPASFHKLIPEFRWAAIFTTNYDLIIEKAYDSSKTKTQDLKPIYKNSDRVDNLLRTTDTIPYIKLHGCITKWNDKEIPLILTVDQYVDHKKNRDRLFNRLDDYGHQYTIVFVGHSLDDTDIRQALLRLNENIEIRPRFFTVTPSVSSSERALWESKKITPLEGTFEVFLLSLDETTHKTLRHFKREKKQHEIEQHFVTSSNTLSKDSLDVLAQDLTFIRQDMPTENLTPNEFFRGNSSGWNAIVQKYDSHRFLNDSILSDVILLEENERHSICEFYLIKGHAGSGKTVSLKRIAWDAAIEYNKICLMWETGNKLDINSIFEICDNCNKRVFLFIDRCSFHVSDILLLKNKAKSQNVPLTIISSERTSEWNIDCEPLHNHLTEEFTLPYLKEKEIKWLLDKLTDHKCLGLIEDLSREKQEIAFREKAGRQLLVALYEATLSKPFEEIIFDEYKNIEPEKARLIYRVICTLNRLEVPVRAGIINRIFGVPFETFKKDFFKPLEHIVQSKRYSVHSDYAYQARHPIIAEIVFEKAITDEQTRFDQYLTILSALDIGYASDRKAFREIIKARNLLKLFSNPILVRGVYNEAKIIGETDSYYHQQVAIFEMKRPNPNFDLAEQHLEIAAVHGSYNPTIVHTRSELELLRAETSHSLEKERYLSKAKTLATQAIRSHQAGNSSHGYHTICKVSLSKIKTLLTEELPNEEVLKELVKEIETALIDGLQQFPGSEFLLDAESQLAQLINDDERAIKSLERAFRVNKLSPFIATALARIYIRNNQVVKARETLEALLDGMPADKGCNGFLAKILTKHYPDETDKAKYYWRRSFTKGDSNFENQFWYARQLYLDHEYSEADEIFRSLKSKQINPTIKNIVKGVCFDQDGNKIKHEGVISRKEATFAFVTNYSFSGTHFIHKNNISDEVWEEIKTGARINYNLGFSYGGPSCLNVTEIK